MTSTKDFSKKVNSVRKKLGELTNVSADADQSTNQSATTTTAHFKSFAHMDTSSEEICDAIEAFMNANCSKYATNKTIQKLCSSNNSKDIDYTLNHLSISENIDDDDHRLGQNVTATSVLHATTHHSHATMLPQVDFAFNALPPNKSESERELRQLIDECVEEKEQVEAGVASLEKCLAKMKENQEKIDAMKKDVRKGGGAKGETADDEVAAVKAKIKKIEKEIQTLKKKEAQREKEECALRKKWEELRWEEDNAENSMREDDGAEKKQQQLETRLQMIEALTSCPVQP